MAPFIAAQTPRKKRAHQKHRRKRQYIGLDDFLKARKLEPHFTTAELLYIRDNVPQTEPLDHQIAASSSACIAEMMNIQRLLPLYPSRRSKLILHVCRLILYPCP